MLAELVPSALWWLNLRSVLRAAEWDALRAAVYEAADHRCEVCGGTGRQRAVEAHEVWAWDVDERAQRLVRVVALCAGCHLVKHAGRARVIGHEDEVIDQLREVNHWTEAQAGAHLKTARDDWARRSALEWRLDLAVLEIEVTDELVSWAKQRVEGERARARGRELQSRGGEGRRADARGAAVSFGFAPRPMGPSVGQDPAWARRSGRWSF